MNKWAPMSVPMSMQWAMPGTVVQWDMSRCAVADAGWRCGWRNGTCPVGEVSGHRKAPPDQDEAFVRFKQVFN